MQSNWSLILNILLLTGVSIAIIRVLWSRRQAPEKEASVLSSPVIADRIDKNDDIIAVRKVHREVYGIPSSGAYQRVDVASRPSIRAIEPTLDIEPTEPTVQTPAPEVEYESKTLMIFLLAKEHRQFAGYELLQTILSSGLRFGEGHLFHRHQFANGQGPVLCSLATATESGTFDLQNIGAFSVHGLCLFMETSGSCVIDEERFSVMVETAHQLAEGLDAHLLDEQRQPWTSATEGHYLKKIQPECV